MPNAFFALDLEDWYHLDYVKVSTKSDSMLDGVDQFIDIMLHHKITPNAFVVSEITKLVRPQLELILSAGGDIGFHGIDHVRPLQKSLTDFDEELKVGKSELQSCIGVEVSGYRAPCLSIDRERLNLVIKNNFKFDSSMINLPARKLYGKIDMDDFTKLEDSIYELNGFFEFEISTAKFFNKKLPFAGGGFFRLFPLELIKMLTKEYVRMNKNVVFFIHPFELSLNNTPKRSITQLSVKDQMRLSINRKSTKNKMNWLIHFLKENDYSFHNFSHIQNKLLK